MTSARRRRPGGDPGGRRLPRARAISARGRPVVGSRLPQADANARRGCAIPQDWAGMRRGTRRGCPATRNLAGDAMKQLHTAWSRRVGLTLVALFALVSAPAPRPVGAQAPAASGPSQGAPVAYGAAVAKAQAVAQQILGHGVPGLALAVAVDGKIVWSDGFGYADLEERVPARATTKFRIGSVSKPLTAAARMRLGEVGKRDLDAPVQKY